MSDDLSWCAVKGAPVSELLTRVHGPNAILRAPTPEETILGKGTYERAPTCFTKGEWTFFVAALKAFDVAAMLSGYEVLCFNYNGTFSWASVEHWVNGAIDWSVYGSVEDDFVRDEGDVPPEAAPFCDASEDCETVPAKVAEAITGFRHDMHTRPKGFKVVEFQLPRELERPGEPPLKNPSIDVIRAAVEQYLATPGSALRLTVDETGTQRTLHARWDGATIIVEFEGRHAMRKSPIAALEPSDVMPCFSEFIADGKPPKSLLWLTPD